MTEATGQRIAAALEALHLATVTGVKGNAEANYRTGDVNITPANIGAVAKSGDTMTGPLTAQSISVKADSPMYYLRDENNLDYAHMRGDNTDHHIIFRMTTPGGNPQLFEDYSLPNPTIQSGPVGYDILTTKSPVGIPQGGTGATTSAVTITNDYSSVLNVINAVKGTRIFPISIQKNQRSSYSDMPSGNETDEWNLLLVGDSMRLIANLYIYRGDQTPKMYLRHVYNGAWLNSWIQVV